MKISGLNNGGKEMLGKEKSLLKLWHSLLFIHQNQHFNNETATSHCCGKLWVEVFSSSLFLSGICSGVENRLLS